MKKSFSAFVAVLLLLSVTISWAVLDVPNARPHVHGKDWKPVLDAVWSGIKTRNVDAYSTGMIHRPKSEAPGDAVSEGVGYGKILALYAGDQTYFNKIWDGGETHMWNGKFYDWRYNPKEGGAATDAEEDVAMMLIFADTNIVVNYAT